MKRTIILLLLLLPLCSFAKDYQFGINGGINFAMGPFNVGMTAQGPGISPHGSLRVLKDKARWQYGAVVEVGSLRSSAQVGDIIYVRRSWQSFNALMTVVSAKAFISPQLFINHKFSKGVYAGASGGYISLSRDSTNYDILTRKGHLGLSGGRGFVMGLQVGCLKQLNSRLSFNMEVSARYAFVYNNNPYRYISWPVNPLGGIGEARKYDVFYLPVTIGLRCKI